MDVVALPRRQRERVRRCPTHRRPPGGVGVTSVIGHLLQQVSVIGVHRDFGQKRHADHVQARSHLFAVGAVRIQPRRELRTTGPRRDGPKRRCRPRYQGPSRCVLGGLDLFRWRSGLQRRPTGRPSPVGSRGALRPSHGLPSDRCASGGLRRPFRRGVGRGPRCPSARSGQTRVTSAADGGLEIAGRCRGRGGLISGAAVLPAFVVEQVLGQRGQMPCPGGPR